MVPSGRDAGEPKIGVDEWVAQAEERTRAGSGFAGALRERARRVPPLGWLGLMVVPAAIFPLLTSSDYLVRVGVNTLIFALLALGLNVVVGYAGLLDLGYVAFYGFGAYAYAILSSAQFDLHWPTIASVPLIVLASALLGLLLGLPSRRLLGDYLAIVTLFFAQIFVTLVTNANRITPPGRDEAVDFTGGPNGIAGVDPLSLFGFALTSVTDYFYLALAIFTVVIGALFLLSESRTGRAWRALREDPLAAQLLGMPINRLKLLAFAFGAAIAGLTGTVFAAVQEGVFPGNFDIALLITIYAMVILGGAGSLGGVVIGAVTINVVLEVLRTPDQARAVFYGVVLAALVAWLRPWRWLAAVLAGTIALGFVVRGLVEWLWSEGTRAAPAGQGWIGEWADRWVILVEDSTRIGNAAYAVLIACVLVLTLLRGLRRRLALIPVLYLAAFVWENRLVLEPSVTRLILLGVLLVALMNARPQGLLGTSRVEIV